MKDHKPEYMSTSDKLARAIGYLKERGIYRGRTQCCHQYTKAENTHISFCQATQQQPVEQVDIRSVLRFDEVAI